MGSVAIPDSQKSGFHWEASSSWVLLLEEPVMHSQEEDLQLSPSFRLCLFMGWLLEALCWEMHRSFALCRSWTIHHAGVVLLKAHSNSKICGSPSKHKLGWNDQWSLLSQDIKRNLYVVTAFQGGRSRQVVAVTVNLKITCHWSY